MHNPSYKELDSKLRKALAAFEHDPDRVVIPETIPVASEIDKLRLKDVAHYLDVIYECIQLALQDPLVTYRKPAPPGKSTRHDLTKNLPMWAFRVKGCSFDPSKWMYFKFCLKEQKNGTYYCHISCHEDQPNKAKKKT